MTARDPNLQIFLDHVAADILGRAEGPALAAASRVFQRLAEHAGRELVLPAERLPVCSHLDGVLSGMSGRQSHMPAMASAFAAVEPRLLWARRKGASPANRSFYDGHANAMLIGPGGIEQHDDVWVGVSLMAPNIAYPDHSHPPEEVYLAFTPGEWWNAAMDWTEPGPGGLIYNPPGILHAMRSGGEPLFALWLLPV